MPPEFRDKSVVDVIVGVYLCLSMALLANRQILGTSGRGRVVLRYVSSLHTKYKPSIATSKFSCIVPLQDVRAQHTFIFGPVLNATLLQPSLLYSQTRQRK